MLHIERNLWAKMDSEGLEVAGRPGGKCSIGWVIGRIGQNPATLLNDNLKMRNSWLMFDGQAKIPAHPN